MGGTSGTMTTLLYKNRIDTISTNSLSTDDEENMIDDDSWKTWVGDNESSTIISGVFDNPSSPGVSQLCEAVAIVHNLPLNTDISIKLFNGGNTDPGDVVHTAPTKKLKPKVSSESIFHASELDSNGYLIDEGRLWQIFIYYPSIPIVCSELDITLTYPGAIDPLIRYVYAGPILKTKKCAGALYVPGIIDYTISNLSTSGNIFSKRKPPKNSMEITWPELDQHERIKMEQARLYSAGRSVILDLYEETNYKGSYDTIWGKFTEDIRISSLTDREIGFYEASCLISEH